MGRLRIQIVGKYKESPQGPYMFMHRLVRALKKNFKVKFTFKKPHILFAAMMCPRKKGVKSVVRIDGCYYNKAFGGNSMNRAIADSIRKCDGVIYQSRFSKRLCEKLLKVKPRKYRTICNGIDQKWTASIPAKEFKEENVFVCNASWRNSKRPKSIIRGFLEADIPDSRLIFVGRFKKQIPHPQITYLDKINAEDAVAHTKAAKVLIHICKIESCPNAVIEALSVGVPVVCNNIGGTKELVKDDGIIVDCDEPFKFNYIRNKNVDNVDPKLIAQGMKECLQRQWSIERPDLDISRAAAAYYAFFQSIL